jgi:hypothetical protein
LENRKLLIYNCHEKNKLLKAKWSKLLRKMSKDLRLMISAGGMDSNQLKRLKELKDENTCLKRCMLNASLGNVMLKDLL